MAQKAAGAADQGILKQTEQVYGDGGADVGMYKAFNEGFSGATKGMNQAMGEKYQKQQATFGALMDNQPNLETVPLLTDEQLAGNVNMPGMETLMKEVSGLYQDQARILSKNKGDMKAQKSITEAASYIQNIDAGNKLLANINVSGYENNGQFSKGISEEQGIHLQEIQLAINGKEIEGGAKIEYPKEDGYNMRITMGDGTVYDKNNPYPVPQGEYQAGSTALLKAANGSIEDGRSSTQPTNAGATSNTMLNLINNLKSDANPDAPATSSEKLDLLFRDLTPDDQDVSYADAFASGNLPPEFYQDDEGESEVITFDDKEKEGDQLSTKPAFDENGVFQWTKEESNNFLRQKSGMKSNIAKFSKYYGGAVSDMHNKELNTKRGGQGTYFKGLDGSDVYGDKADIKIKKKQVYSEMLFNKSITNVDNNGNLLEQAGESGDYGNVIESIQNTYEGTDVDIKSDGSSAVMVTIGSKEQFFELDNPRQVKLMQQFIGTSKSYDQVALNADPNSWTDLDGTPIYGPDPSVNNSSSASVDGEVSTSWYRNLFKPGGFSVGSLKINRK